MSIPAEAFIPVIVLHYAVNLLIPKQYGGYVSPQISRQVMVHPASTYELGKLLLA